MQRTSVGSTAANLSFIPRELRLDITDLGVANARGRELSKPETQDREGCERGGRVQGVRSADMLGLGNS